MNKIIKEINGYTLKQGDGTNYVITNPQGLPIHKITGLSVLPDIEKSKKVFIEIVSNELPLCEWSEEMLNHHKNKKKQNLLWQKKRQQQEQERKRKELDKIENSFFIQYPESEIEISDLMNYLETQLAKQNKHVRLKIDWDYYEIKGIRIEPTEL